MLTETGSVNAPRVALSIGARFENRAGATAVTTERWVIYAPSPGDIIGGLNSGTTALWGGTVTSVAPGTLTSNRYVFSPSPTLTFRSLDLTKLVGEDVTDALTYAVDGFHSGVLGLFTGDSAAPTFTGMPQVSSAGADASASPIGSPYVIDIARGSLVATSGYTFDFVDSGRLTVTYVVCARYDQTKVHRAGSTVPVKLQLCDINGKNLSTGSVVVHASSRKKTDSTISGVVSDSGAANSPDNNFRYDATLGGYIYNFNTKDLTTGTWVLSFTVDSQIDSRYSVQFDIK